MVPRRPNSWVGMDYHFRSLGRTCSATGAALAPGAWCRSALVERDGRLERLDFLQTAWNGPPEGTIGHWRLRIPDAAAVKPKMLSPDELMAEFERMEDDGHPHSRRLRYVLALLLLGRRRMELESTRCEEEIDYLVLTGTKGEGPFEVRNEALAPEEISAIQQQLLASWATSAAEQFDAALSQAVEPSRN